VTNAKKAQWVLACMLVLSVAIPATAWAQRRGERQLRNLSGQVFGNHDAPLNGAIVYIKNTKTLAVKTYITSQDGAYRFNALSPNVDYELYAEYQSKRSGTKTLSSFDDRPEPRLDIHIDVGK
jgi:carboxypeptidase family protein